MNVSFVLLMAMCNIPGGSFGEQDITDINMEKLSRDEQRTLEEAWSELDKDLWMEAQQIVYSMILDKVTGKFDIKRRVSSNELFCGSMLFQLMSHTFVVEMADSAPEIQRQFNEVVNFKGLTIKELDVHVEKVMKVLQKMERNPDAALSETLKKQTILNGFSAPNKLPHRYLQHLGTILHDQVKDPNFGVERIFSRVREELTKYNPESKFEDQTRMIPSTSGPSANVVFETSSPEKLVARIKDVLSDFPGYSATEVLGLFDKKHRLHNQSGSALLTCQHEEEGGNRFRPNFQNRQWQGRAKQFVMQERQFRAKDSLYKQNQQLKQQIRKLEKEKTQPVHQNQPPQKKLKADDRAQMAMDARDEWGVVYNPEHEHGAHAQMAEVVPEGGQDGDLQQDSPRPSISGENAANVEQCEESKSISESCRDDEELNPVSEFGQDSENIMNESKGFDASSTLETNRSEDKQGDEHDTEPEDSDKMFHQESEGETGKSEDEEFDNSSNTSYFFKMRKMMFKSMVSLAVGVAFLAILFSVWGIQLPFAEGQRLSQIGSHAMFNRNFSPSRWVGNNSGFQFLQRSWTLIKNCSWRSKSMFVHHI